MSSFQGVSEAIRADRASHYWNHRRQGGQGHPDPGRPRPGRSSASSCYSPEARGRSVFGTSACPRNSGSPASPTWSRPTASSRRSSCHNTTPAPTPAEDQGTAFVPFTGALDDILCIHEERSLKRQHGALQAPGTSAYVKARVRVHEYPDGWPSSMDRDVWRDTTPMANRSTPNPRGRVFDATDRLPVDKWTAAPRPTTSPQGQKPQQKRSTHMVHKPVNSECSRQVPQALHCLIRGSTRFRRRLIRDFPDDSSQPPKRVAQSSIDRKRSYSSWSGGLG